MLNNNIFLSILAGFIACCLLWLEKTMTNQQHIDKKEIIKIFIIVSVLMYGILYLKGNKNVNDMEIYTGNPNF